MHRNKKFVEKNIIPSRMSPLYAFHDVQTLPCNAELNFIINPDHLQSSNLTIAATITQDDDVHNLRTYLQSWHYNAGQLEIKNPRQTGSERTKSGGNCEREALCITVVTFS